jgi:hypothetical protein
MTDGSSMNQPNTAVPSRVPYTNTVLTVIAVLLGVIVLDRAVVRAGAADGILGGPSAARAEIGPDDEEIAGARISAADQRKVIIAELRNLSHKLDGIDARLGKGLNVKVTDMPPVRMQGERPAPSDKQSNKGEKPGDAAAAEKPVAKAPPSGRP